METIVFKGFPKKALLSLRLGIAGGGNDEVI